ASATHARLSVQPRRSTRSTQRLAGPQVQPAPQSASEKHGASPAWGTSSPGALRTRETTSATPASSASATPRTRPPRPSGCAGTGRAGGSRGGWGSIDRAWRGASPEERPSAAPPVVVLSTVTRGAGGVSVAGTVGALSRVLRSVSTKIRAAGDGAEARVSATAGAPVVGAPVACGSVVDTG